MSRFYQANQDAILIEKESEINTVAYVQRMAKSSAVIADNMMLRIEYPIQLVEKAEQNLQTTSNYSESIKEKVSEGKSKIDEIKVFVSQLEEKVSILRQKITVEENATQESAELKEETGNLISNIDALLMRFKSLLELTSTNISDAETHIIAVEKSCADAKNYSKNADIFMNYSKKYVGYLRTYADFSQFLLSESEAVELSQCSEEYKYQHLSYSCYKALDYLNRGKQHEKNAKDTLLTASLEASNSISSANKAISHANLSEESISLAQGYLTEIEGLLSESSALAKKAETVIISPEDKSEILFILSSIISYIPNFIQEVLVLCANLSNVKLGL